MKSLQQQVLLAMLLVPPAVMAHPGHGLGSLGHGLQHALWNFAGLAVITALFLLGDRLAGPLKLLLQHCVGKTRNVLLRRRK